MQRSFFAEEEREEKLTKMGDVLQQINAVVNWEIFRPILDEVFPRKNNPKGGRPPFDSLFMFNPKALQPFI